MTAYPLHPLLRLRNFREDRAVHDLEVAKRRLIQAQRELQAAQKAHRDFLGWLAKEEERRYREILNTLMDLEEVDAFKQGLLRIRGREARFLDGILKSEHRVHTREQELVRAKVNLLTAQKGTKKIEVHRDIWAEVARREAERSEEREMEDFIGARVDFLGHGFADEQEGWS